MSTTTAPPPVPPAKSRRVRGDGLWERISEGKELGDLWTQFSADAQASYGFYDKDVDWKSINELPWWKRPRQIAKQIFWALLLKLTPARRVFLFLALSLLVLSATNLHGDGNLYVCLAALCFLFLLAQALSDDATMKRDLAFT